MRQAIKTAAMRKIYKFAEKNKKFLRTVQNLENKIVFIYIRHPHAMNLDN